MTPVVRRNHQVPQNGGVMVIRTEAGRSFQTPSLLAPRTWKT